MALLTLDGLKFLLRWFHIFFGVIWIGHLYYFNFVQGAFFAETDAGTKSAAIQKLVPRALWWFRWGAMWTLVTGLLLFSVISHQLGPVFMMSSRGVIISMGMMFGLVMWANVWLIIWPNQKVVIASATQVAQGKPAIPEAAALGAKAGLASRHNVLFSIPMLFLMAGANHLPIQIGPQTKTGLLFGLFGGLLLLLELNAIKGKLGLITTVKGVVTWGFVLTAVVYAMLEFCA